MCRNVTFARNVSKQLQVCSTQVRHLIERSVIVLKINIPALIAHKVVHAEKKFKCQLCDVWFKTSGNMKEHMKVHKGLVFKCSYCGKDFNKIGNLRLHEKRHTKSLKQFYCDLCPRWDCNVVVSGHCADAKHYDIFQNFLSEMLAQVPHENSQRWEAL